VTVKSGAVVQKGLVQSGTGYLSQNDMRQHFGLAGATTVDSVEVTWPDGTTTRRDSVKADQVIQIAQEAARK
ncbi:MAG TPA: ASPIC/UnbV domain-containing protein, partial [Vicinamibacterales bacterium]|nr:ASPIC/UnbV domain-containing protein [Vicinamibacterales bacterium]